MLYSDKSKDKGESLSPTPSTYLGVFSIKKGQSAPSLRDNFSNSILEILRLNN